VHYRSEKLAFSTVSVVLFANFYLACANATFNPRDVIDHDSATYITTTTIGEYLPKKLIADILTTVKL
jgi:hypothetical protein